MPPSPQPPSPSAPTNDRKTLGDAAEVGRVIDGLDVELMELKANYEQYFAGVERRPPADRHRQLKKKLSDLRNTFVRQTSVKFRVGTLQQKFATYERLWNRTLQEIEDGTYKRDLFKARLRNPSRSEREADADAKRLEAELEAAEKADAGRLEALKAKEQAEAKASAEALAAAARTDLSPALKVGAPNKPVSNPGSGAFVAAKPKTVSSPGLAPVAPPNASPPVRPMTTASPSAPGAPSAPGGTGVKPAAQTVVPGLNAVRVPSGVSVAVKPASSPSVPAVGAPTRPVSNPGVGSVPPPRAGAPVSTAGAAALSDQKVKAIYDAYVTAKRRCNEDTSSLSFDSVASTLRKQVPELMKTHNAKSVDFKVVIKDGKAVLRAVPKE